MRIELKRDKYTARTTLGKLYIEGEYFCETLEDTVRPFGVKVAGETAIPAGDYSVFVTMSNRFKREMPIISTDKMQTIIINGVSFVGVRFHGGNTHENTHGCPLVAKNRLSNDMIQGSMEKPLTAKIKLAIQAGDRVKLHVRNGVQNA